MAKAQDLYQLRDQMLDSLEKLRQDPRRHNQVKEEFNGYGKILASIKIVQDHCVNLGLENNDPMLKGIGGKPLQQLTNAKLIAA